MAGCHEKEAENEFIRSAAVPPLGRTTSNLASRSKVDQDLQRNHLTKCT